MSLQFLFNWHSTLWSNMVLFLSHSLSKLYSYKVINLDTDIAPIWDSEKNLFIAMMTMSDFIQSLRAFKTNGIPVTELATKSIADMLETPLITFRHSNFIPISAEDNIFQMCMLLQRQSTNFVPIIDPDTFDLVSILGYLDIVNLLDVASKKFPHLFMTTIEETRVGTYPVITAQQSALLTDVLNVLEERHISSIPIVDENDCVIGLYYKSDTTFITRAPDPGAVMASIGTVTVGEVIHLQQLQQQTGESLSTSQGSICTSTLQNSLKDVLSSMMNARVTRVVCVDGFGKCLGIISIKDIIWYYLNSSKNQSNRH